MASINGISIKSKKNFLGHEGEPLAQGNVYYRGKKLGFWSQDSWGGPDRFEFDEEILKKEVEKFRNSNLVEDKYRKFTDLSILLYRLLDLMEDEKEFKKCLKNGYKRYVVATDGFHVSGYFCFAKDKKYHEKFLAECKKVFFKNEPIKVKEYSSLDDFEVEV